MRKETIEVLVIEKDDKPSDYVVEAWVYPIVIQESTNVGPKLYSCRGLPRNGEKVKLGDGIKNLDAKLAASTSGIIDGLNKVSKVAEVSGLSFTDSWEAIVKLQKLTGESASNLLDLVKSIINSFSTPPPEIAASVFNNLPNMSDSFNSEEVRLPFFDRIELRNFLEKCKDLHISTENERDKKVFELLKKTFPNLRFEGSWTKGRHKYFIGKAPVKLFSSRTGPEASFIEGPAKDCRFSTLEGLGHLLRCYKGLDRHILGDLKQ